MHRIVVSILVCLCTAGLWAQGTGQAAPDAAQRQRIHHLEESLMAPCCWAEPVSMHRSEIALQMRAEIEKAVLDGASDQAILQHYKDAYGARILVEPEGAFRLWAYLIPALAAVLGLGAVVLVIRRMRGGGSAELPAQ